MPRTPPRPWASCRNTRRAPTPTARSGKRSQCVRRSGRSWPITSSAGGNSGARMPGWSEAQSGILTAWKDRPALRFASCGLRLHRQHDLAEMRVGAHVRVRLRRLVEREAAIDRQLKLACRHRVPEIGAHAAADLTHLVERASAEGDTDIVDAAQRMQVEIELGLGAGETADIDDAAEHRGR